MSFCIVLFCSLSPLLIPGLGLSVFRICSDIMQMCHLGVHCHESSSAMRRSQQKHHCHSPSVHPLSMSQELHLCHPRSLPELLQACCAQPCAWPGWLDLRPTVSLPVFLAITGLCQPHSAFHLYVRWDWIPCWRGHCPTCLPVAMDLGSLSFARHLTLNSL